MKDGSIERVTIVGAGQMGYGIGLEFARYGYPVALYDITEDRVKKAMESVKEDLNLMVEAELLSQAEADATYQRIRPSTDIVDAAKDADYVVEAVTETLSIKHEVFSKLDGICPPPAILATNTSGLKVTDIASVAKHPERILATHYFHPPHFVPLVEVSGGEKTERKYVERTAEILRGIHKKAVVIDVELPGFLGNRIQNAIFAEIRSLIDQGVCTPSMIDDVISYGFGRRLAYVGFFKRYDMIGLDFIYTAMSAWGSELWKPIVEHYEKGEYGIKSGRGFYDWPDDTGVQFETRLKKELLRLMKQEIEQGLL